jgi:hypothetical protein
MFNWPLFLCLVLVGIPGLVAATPNLVAHLEKTTMAKLPPGKTPPSRGVLVATIVGQSLLLLAAAPAVGTALAPRLGLRAPFFEALVSGQPLWPALAPQLLPALAGGLGGALVLMAAYYLVFRPRLDAQTVRSMEALRMVLGPWARVLYGGIVEELLFRWGVLTLLAWIGAQLFGKATPAVMWAAILISGVFFGLGHIPNYRQAGCRVTPWFAGLAIVLNLWATLICGWLFWQYGLLAAMIAHMLYHLVWLPFDLHFYRRLEVGAGSGAGQ